MLPRLRTRRRPHRKHGRHRQKGDVITAKCLGVDKKGRIRISRRAWLRDQAAEKAETQPLVAAE